MIVTTSQNENYVTEIFNGNEKIFADTTRGKGGSGSGFRPHEFLEAAFASCLNITTRMILNSMNVQYEKIAVKVELNRENADKTFFNYKIDIIPEVGEFVKNIVMEKVKSCPVKKTLSKQLVFQNFHCQQ